MATHPAGGEIIATPTMSLAILYFGFIFNQYPPAVNVRTRKEARKDGSYSIIIMTDVA